MKQCRIGILGAGRIGKLHAENICSRLPQFSLVGIADPYIEMEWARSINIPLITKESNELIQHPDIDAILIATPSDQHIQQMIAASDANKAIFCEKPMGLTESDIKTALAVITKKNTLLQIGFNRRFDPDFANLKQRVQSGEIGDPYLVLITSRDPACPPIEYAKKSGGLFMDMTIHDFDMARFLAGAEVVEVYATGSVLINPEFSEFNDIDTAVIQLRFANGALGVIDNSRQAVYGYDQRVEVFGSEGSLLAKNHTQHAVTHFNQEDIRHANLSYFFLERYQAAYLSELETFYDTWVQGKPSVVSGHDGLQALRIAMAANQSLKTKQPIRLE